MRIITTEMEAREYLESLRARAEELFGMNECSMPDAIVSAKDIESFQFKGPGISIGVAVQRGLERRTLVPWVYFELGSAEPFNIHLCYEEPDPVPTLTIGADALDVLIERAVQVREAFSANVREISRHVVELGGPLLSDSPVTSSDPDHIPF